MMKIIRVLPLFLALIGSSVTGVAMADCNFTQGGKIVSTMPLQGGNITVGRDVPLGTEVFRQTFRASTLVKVTCDLGVYSITSTRSLTMTPLPLSSWSGTPYSGRVYESGVPGIGVALWYAGNAFPYISTLANCGGGTNNCVWNLQNSLSFDVSLIKIGEVSAGTIQGSQLPSMQQDYTTSNTVQLEQVGISGSINVVSRTCDTPDVTVEMGSHKTSEFSGVGSSTPWQDFSIRLNNCPAFYGMYSGSAGPDWTSDGTIAMGVSNANIIKLRIDPTQTAIDPAQGILVIDSGARGDPLAATGIGVQMADSTSSPVPLATLLGSGITPQATDGASYSIPLRARYIQTTDTVTPGPANATAIFTINYQ